MSGTAAVEAEDELIEIGLKVLAAQAVIDAERPDLEVGEDAVHPRQDDVGRHLADHMGIMMDAGGAGITGQPVGLGGGTGGEIGAEECMQAGGRVIGYLFEADAAGAVGLQPTGLTCGTAVLHLDGADDEDLALAAAPAAASERIVLAAAGKLGSPPRSAALPGRSSAVTKRPAPTVLLIAALASDRLANSNLVPATAMLFASGYLLVWCVFGLAATLLQWGL